MIGIENVVDDYLYHSENFPNLQKLFLECNCNEFIIFRTIFDNVIKISDIEMRAGKTGCLALKEKDICLNFITDNILLPYCQKNPDRANQILSKFNELFGVYGYVFSMDDIKSNNKNL